MASSMVYFYRSTCKNKVLLRFTNNTEITEISLKTLVVSIKIEQTEAGFAVLSLFFFPVSADLHVLTVVIFTILMIVY